MSVSAGQREASAHGPEQRARGSWQEERVDNTVRAECARCVDACVHGVGGAT